MCVRRLREPQQRPPFCVNFTTCVDRYCPFAICPQPAILNFPASCHIYPQCQVFVICVHDASTLCLATVNHPIGNKSQFVSAVFSCCVVSICSQLLNLATAGSIAENVFCRTNGPNFDDVALIDFQHDNSLKDCVSAAVTRTRHGTGPDNFAGVPLVC